MFWTTTKTKGNHYFSNAWVKSSLSKVFSDRGFEGYVIALNPGKNTKSPVEAMNY